MALPGVAASMAPRLPKLPKVNLKLPSVKLPGRKAPEAAPAEAPAPAPAPPAPRFVELESRPAHARPAPRDAPVLEGPAELALQEEVAEPAPPESPALPEAPAIASSEWASPAPPPRPTVADQPVTNIEGVGEVFGEKLRAEGIETIEDLMLANEDFLARRTGISANLIAKWQAMGTLQAVNGIGPQHSELLVRAEVRSLRELASFEPAALAAKLNAYQDGLGQRVESGAITPATVEPWIQGARDIVGVPAAPPATEPAAEPMPAFAEPAPEPAPPVLAEAPKPRFALPRIALPFAKRAEARAEDPAAAPAVEVPRRRGFALGLGRKKDVPPDVAAEASGPVAEAEATPEAPAASEAAPPKGRGFGFSLGRKEKEEPTTDAAPVEAPAPAKRRFTFGKPKPAPAPPPAEAVQEPPPPAEVAPVARPVTLTLPIPPQMAAVPPQMPPMEEPGPAMAPPAFMGVPRDFDYDHMHLRVDRILSDKSPYHAPLVAAPRAIDPLAVDDQVDELLDAKAPKARPKGRRR